jgi:hypothetical protein
LVFTDGVQESAFYQKYVITLPTSSGIEKIAITSDVPVEGTYLGNELKNRNELRERALFARDETKKAKAV